VPGTMAASWARIITICGDCCHEAADIDAS
jgi:hypothetical protein